MSVLDNWEQNEHNEFSIGRLADPPTPAAVAQQSPGAAGTRWASPWLIDAYKSRTA